MNNTTNEDLDKFALSLKANFSDNDSQIADVLIDNAVNQIKSPFAPKDSQSIKNDLDEAVLVIKDILALRQIIGVQPMSGPLTTAYHLKSTNNELDQQSLKVSSHAVQAMSMKFMNDAIEKLTYGKLFVNYILSKLYVLGSSNNIQQHDCKNSITELILKITEASGSILQKTNVGIGNFIVVSPKVSEIIASFFTFEKSKNFSNDTNYSDGLVNVGVLNSVIKVYVNNALKQNDVNEFNILVGYHGGSDINTGCILTPYIPFLSSDAIDVSTGNQVKSVLTRFGIYVDEKEGPSKSNNYYSVIKLINM